ncbi:MAG: helix-turn-helix transcriptional regulator [Caldilineaceae bacterium]|nr:helix-turn-helix transcriptional regulator [Caldilineaceae bacterium]
MTTNAVLAGSDLGKRIYLSRRDLNWGQDELAASSGVSRGYISNIERGRITNVGVEVLVALAQALGISPAYLMGFTDNPLANLSDEDEPVMFREDQAATTPDPITADLLAIIQVLDAEQKRQLAGVARVLFDRPHIIE